MLLTSTYSASRRFRPLLQRNSLSGLLPEIGHAYITVNNRYVQSNNNPTVGHLNITTDNKAFHNCTNLIARTYTDHSLYLWSYEQEGDILPFEGLDQVMNPVII